MILPCGVSGTKSYNPNSSDRAEKFGLHKKDKTVHILVYFMEARQVKFSKGAPALISLALQTAGRPNHRIINAFKEP